MEITGQSVQKIHLQLRELEGVLPVPDKAPSSEALDKELDRLRAPIRKTYIKCFGKDTNLAPLTQLERIEVGIDRMHGLLEQISPEFIMGKQLLREKERREEQRQERQEKAAEEQRIKIAQAVERAKQPIKPKTGRPLLPRSMPIRVEKNDDAKLAALRREQERLEMLLFGPVFPD
jgi:hypothetical protein